MDVFVEQIVFRNLSLKDKVLRAIILVFAAVIIIFLGITAISGILAPVSIVAIPGVIWLAMSIIKSGGVEYEYILTNKELDIDKIYGKSKRKRMITLDLTNAKGFGKYREGESITSDVTVVAHDNSYINLWYLDTEHTSNGRVVLLFNPDDRFIENLNKVLPHRVKNLCS